MIEQPMAEIANKEFPELVKTSPNKIKKLIREKALAFVVGEWKKITP